MAMEVRFEEGGTELCWHHELAEVKGNVPAPRVAPPMAVIDSEHGKTGEHDGLGLPFGYRLERDSDLLILRRADGSRVASFGAVGLDLFEVELAVLGGHRLAARGASLGALARCGARPKVWRSYARPGPTSTTL